MRSGYLPEVSPHPKTQIQILLYYQCGIITKRVELESAFGITTNFEENGGRAGRGTRGDNDQRHDAVDGAEAIKGFVLLSTRRGRKFENISTPHHLASSSWKQGVTESHGHVPGGATYQDPNPSSSFRTDSFSAKGEERDQDSFETLTIKQSYHYGPGHPMKPHRLRLTHHLLLSYGLYRKMQVLRPHKASAEEMERFHAHDYVDFLRRVSPLTEKEVERLAQRFQVGPGTDCPNFSGVYDFMSVCAGGSIDAAMKINRQESDICVNWAGGLHHAKKAEAEGFCYINDIVLCILELLKYHARVLYVDIDIHHGDGVEEAFYTTNRVMTVSFHKYGDFFPGTGALEDIGTGAGKYCSVNVPLANGLDDVTFQQVYKPVLTKVFQVFQPEAVVMCCGADSIAGDRIGCWNMSLRGHGGAIDFMKTFNVPIVLLGGGGYTPRNVARCWAYETAVGLGEHNELRDEIPNNELYAAYGPNPRLHVDIDPNLENKNTRAYVDPIVQTVLENLSQLKGPPSIPFQDVPRDFYSDDVEDPSELRPDEAMEEKKDPTSYAPGTECGAGSMVD